MLVRAYDTAIVARGVTFVVAHYDLRSLMAGKLRALLARHYRMGGTGSIWWCGTARRPPVVRTVLNESLAGRSLSPRAGGAACRRRSGLPGRPRRYG